MYPLHFSINCCISAGTGLSKSISSPVEGCTNPKLRACNACLGHILKQFWTNCLYLVKVVPFNI